MHRRSVLASLGGAASGWPLWARAQQRRISKVGFVQFATSAADEQILVPFRKGLSALGYVEGKTVIIEAREAKGNIERAHAFIDELTRNAELLADFAFIAGLPAGPLNDSKIFMIGLSAVLTMMLR